MGGVLHSTQFEKKSHLFLQKVFRINLKAMLSAGSFLVVNGLQLQEEENLCIWNRAAFKRSVQYVDMSHAAVSP